MHEIDLFYPKYLFGCQQYLGFEHLISLLSREITLENQLGKPLYSSTGGSKHRHAEACATESLQTKASKILQIQKVDSEQVGSGKMDKICTHTCKCTFFLLMEQTWPGSSAGNQADSKILWVDPGDSSWFFLANTKFFERFNHWRIILGKSWTNFLVVDRFPL